MVTPHMSADHGLWKPSSLGLLMFSSWSFGVDQLSVQRKGQTWEKVEATLLTLFFVFVFWPEACQPQVRTIQAMLPIRTGKEPILLSIKVVQEVWMEEFACFTTTTTVILLRDQTWACNSSEKEPTDEITEPIVRVCSTLLFIDLALGTIPFKEYKN